MVSKLLLSRLRTFLAFPEWFYLNEPVNTLTPPRRTPGGLASQFSSGSSHFDLADDAAMTVTVPAGSAERSRRTRSIQLHGSMWYISLDYIQPPDQPSPPIRHGSTPTAGCGFVISEREPRGWRTG